MNLKISTEFIKLDSLLKFSGVADSGSFAKELIADGLVTYNGEVCLMRGKKVYPGDRVVVDIPGEFREEICVE
ncbi:MAG: RNA-binding S4 domain-containing protein [Clostridia bacterium]|nr:RNA-binding S4 domain-containing protein [Clostridia bacterium]